MLGKVELEKIFGRQLSSEYYIHRTRKGFGNNGFDNFSAMAKKSVSIVDKIVEQKLNGLLILLEMHGYLKSHNNSNNSMVQLVQSSPYFVELVFAKHNSLTKSAFVLRETYFKFVNFTN